MKPACFLDRDGVIVEDIGYLSDPEDLVVFAGAGEAIRGLNEQGVPVVVVTNQAGVGRGYFEEGRLVDIHARLDEILAADGAHIDRYYYCPHHPTAAKGEYLIDCQSRKPNPGMLLRASRELDLQLDRSFLIGDKGSDLLAGQRAGCTTVLVRTGYGEEFARDSASLAGYEPSMIADSIVDAIAFCVASGLGRA